MSLLIAGIIKANEIWHQSITYYEFLWSFFQPRCLCVFLVGVKVFLEVGEDELYPEFKRAVHDQGFELKCQVFSLKIVQFMAPFFHVGIGVDGSREGVGRIVDIPILDIVPKVFWRE